MKKVLILAAASLLLASCTDRKTETTVDIDTEAIVVENILNRRSVRDYTDQKVSKEQLEVLMECAINAPSGQNKQPWEVRVVQDAEFLGKMREINERAGFNAPVVIFIARDTQNGGSTFDCGLLTQNIVLAAEAMDLGTCIIGGVIPALRAPEAAPLMDQLRFPENYEIVIGITLGHKNERPDAKPRDASKVKYIL